MGIFASTRSGMVERDERFDTTDPITLRIKAHIGDIHVRMSEADQPTRVQLITHAKADQGYSERIVVQHDATAHTLSIDTTPLKRLLTTVAVDITVWVAPSSNVHIQAANADITIDGSYRQLHLSTAAGDINLSGIAQQMTVQSASGDITATQCHSQEITITTASGDIHCGPCIQTLNLTTASGDIQAMAATQVSIQTASGDVSLQVDIPTHATIRTASGDINVRIHTGFLTDVNAKTLSGDIHSNLTFDGDSTSAEPVDVQLHIQSLSGDIAIRK